MQDLRTLIDARLEVLRPHIAVTLRGRALLEDLVLELVELVVGETVVAERQRIRRSPETKPVRAMETK